MARRPIKRAAVVQTEGLYGRLAEAEERRRRQWDANIDRSHHDGAPYPRQRILDSFRAGRTVNIPRGELPDTADPGGGPAHWWQRAIVHPDDRVSCNDDDGARLWLEENGL